MGSTLRERSRLEACLTNSSEPVKPKADGELRNPAGRDYPPGWNTAKITMPMNRTVGTSLNQRKVRSLAGRRSAANSLTSRAIVAWLSASSTTRAILACSHPADH